MISKKQEQENNRKLEKAALEFYNSFQKKRRSPGLKDVLVFRAQKASFGSITWMYLLILFTMPLAGSLNR